MDIKQIDKAAEIIFRLCSNHPELCPHDWEWHRTSFNKEKDVMVQEFNCRICGSRRKEESPVPGEL